MKQQNFSKVPCSSCCFSEKNMQWFAATNHDAFPHTDATSTTQVPFLDHKHYQIFAISFVVYRQKKDLTSSHLLILHQTSCAASVLFSSQNGVLIVFGYCNGRTIIYRASATLSTCLKRYPKHGNNNVGNAEFHSNICNLQHFLPLSDYPSSYKILLLMSD